MSTTPPPLTCQICKCLRSALSGSHRVASEDCKFRLFHCLCYICRQRDSSCSEQLCSFCQHMRLDHQLHCSSGPYKNPIIYLGSHENISARAQGGCQLCHMLSAVCQDISKQTSSEVLGFDLEISKAGALSFAQLTMWMIVLRDGIVSKDLSVRLNAYRSQSLADLTRNAALVQPLVQWHRVRQWYEYCHGNHNICRSVSLTAPPEAFRLIDTSERRLVKPSEPKDYVALSYVWGQCPDSSKLLALLTNISDLAKPGALRPSLVSAAINDAIEICKNLGQRYLWVDRLCIIQDDQENKQTAIATMGDIYSAAKLVLIISSTANCDEHVTGQGTPRTTLIRTYTTPALHLCSVLPTFETVADSIWASRGWTYQEAALNCHRLYVTPYQVIYSCEEGQIYEDNSSNEDHWSEIDKPRGEEMWNSIRPARLSNPRADKFFSFTLHLAEYNARNLTNSDDVYNAFAGIAAALYNDVDVLYYGLPLIDFDKALLWYAHFKPMQHAARIGKRVLLPSWSWSCMIGKISQLDTRLDGPLVQWLRADSKVRSWHVIQEPVLQEKLIIEDSSHALVHMSIAIAEGCLAASSITLPRWWETKTYEQAVGEFSARWPTSAAFYDEVRSQSRVLAGSQHALPSQDSATIAAWAQISALRVRSHISHVPGHACRVHDSWKDILNPAGEAIGMMAPATPISECRPSSSDLTYEFLGLSIGRFQHFSPAVCLGLTGKNGRLSCRNPRISYLDSEQADNGSIIIAYVMCVTRKHTTARRVSVGWIYLKCWAALPRSTEFIVLV